MTMKLVKKTDDFSIYARGDGRYAVRDADRRPVNGEDKVRILAAEGLVTLTAPAPAAEEAPQDAAEESAGSGESDSDGGEADDTAAE